MDECGGDAFLPPPRWRRGAIRCFPAFSEPEVDGVDDADGRKKNPPSFPCRHLRGAPPAHRRNINGRAAAADDDDSSVSIRPGPHGLHAYASRYLKAGSVIVRCLPLAHSILVPPGTTTTTATREDDDDDDDDGGGGGGGGGGRGRRRRCARCFFGEGESNHSGGRRGANFGRCSRCRAVHYCSRSCQVRCDTSTVQHPPRRLYLVVRHTHLKSLLHRSLIIASQNKTGGRLEGAAQTGVSVPRRSAQTTTVAVVVVPPREQRRGGRRAPPPSGVQQAEIH